MYNDVPCVFLQFDFMIKDMTNNRFALYRVYNEKANQNYFIETAKSILNINS